jgi:NAD(P)-dependent dehydrogenase (short-subunit alcohol dehydrogenase family)
MTSGEAACRTAAITGAGGGLGRSVALKLAEKGQRVYGTELVDAEVDELRDASDGRVSLSVTDITDEQAVRTWTTRVGDEIGPAGLNVLVSNAGILTPAPLEVLPLQAIKREFDVNVFGSISVINAFLPALRAAHGRIVQVGAMRGRLPLPFNGPSSASKAAFEALADVYPSGLKPFGVEFVLAQAGNMRIGGPANTAAAMKRVTDSFTDAQRDLYGEEFAKSTASLNKSQSERLSADESADRIVEPVEEQPAPARAPVGPDAEKILRLVAEKSDLELDELRCHYVGPEPNFLERQVPRWSWHTPGSTTSTKQPPRGNPTDWLGHSCTRSMPPTMPRWTRFWRAGSCRTPTTVCAAARQRRNTMRACGTRSQTCNCRWTRTLASWWRTT